ncbi:Sulfhydryl oxidase [Melia azedarach]|uniref:Sulfhydryl oxidase n=1 Tax=Melia azedarach TaxID=155640 RepID=A0ACC1WS05_MELAZ|nr:Sulfhydryl oxidase [Melia azedarach]
MKVSGFWVLLFVIGTAIMLLSFSRDKTSSSMPDAIFAQHSGGMAVMAVTTASRKLKENGYNSNNKEKHNVGKVNLEDYHPIDPVPSSKASVRPGPIEHGSPLIPYIPRPSPPGGHSTNGGSV